MIRSTTKNVKTVWEVELFPFDSVYPDTPDSKAAASTAKNANAGIISLRISRSKATPSGSCSFVVAGPTQPGCFPGTWVVVSSISTMPGGKPRKLIRFIGQIASMNTEYRADPERGGVQTRTSYTAREWSSVLETTVRWDIFSILAARQAKPNAAGGLLNFKIATGISEQQLMNVAKNSFNAYELAQLFLRLIGGISAQDRVSKIKEFGDIGLPETAVRLPSVPKALLERLGLLALGPPAPGQSVINQDQPFQTGFMDTITGVQQVGMYNGGDWDGVFATPVLQQGGLAALKELNVSSVSSTIEDYKAIVNKEVKNRAITIGLAALAGVGASAWDLITQYCDPAVNEFFTDILYQDLGGGYVSAKPVVFLRDKPFLMKRFGIKTAGQWTYYDDLPRVKIDSAYIQSFSLQNTFLGSPNLIRVLYQPQSASAAFAKMASQLNTLRFPSEMTRFGGQEFDVQTQFLSLDILFGKGSAADGVDWFRQVVEVTSAWHAYRYRMADGRLVMRDDNVPITCGFNAQFLMGKYKIVGHVESIEINFGIDPASGRFETTSSVQLSRLVHDFNGRLEFIPPDHMSALLKSEPAVVPDPSSGIPKIAGLAAKFVKNLLGG